MFKSFELYASVVRENVDQLRRPLEAVGQKDEPFHEGRERSGDVELLVAGLRLGKHVDAVVHFKSLRSCGPEDESKDRKKDPKINFRRYQLFM